MSGQEAELGPAAGDACAFHPELWNVTPPSASCAPRRGGLELRGRSRGHRGPPPPPHPGPPEETSLFVSARVPLTRSASPVLGASRRPRGCAQRPGWPQTKGRCPRGPPHSASDGHLEREPGGGGRGGGGRRGEEGVGLASPAAACGIVPHQPDPGKSHHQLLRSLNGSPAIFWSNLWPRVAKGPSTRSLTLLIRWFAGRGPEQPGLAP